MKRACICGHARIHHRNEHGECFLAKCKCTLYVLAKRIAGSSKYCQSSPPPGYSPSPEPEPIYFDGGQS